MAAAGGLGFPDESKYLSGESTSARCFVQGKKTARRGKRLNDGRLVQRHDAAKIANALMVLLPCRERVANVFENEEHWQIPHGGQIERFVKRAPVLVAPSSKYATVTPSFPCIRCASAAPTASGMPPPTTPLAPRNPCLSELTWCLPAMPLQ